MGSVLDKNSAKVRKRIEDHAFADEGGEEYGASEFHGFGDYFRRKKIKLQNLDADMRASSSKPQLFKGIVAHVTGYTQPPLHILHREIVQHGGGFLQYLDSKTMATHIIASTLPQKKSVDFSRYRIVKPAWIMNSITVGKLLPWSEYRVLDEGPRQKVLKFDGSKGLTQENGRPKQGYSEQIEHSFYAAQLQNTAGSTQALSQMVEEAGATDSSPLASISHSSNAGPAQSSLPVTPSKDHQDHDTHKVSPGRQRVDLPSEPFDSPGKQNQLKSKASEPPKNATSEEHNAWLLSDPRLRKSSTANPEFLKQFYSESRLHHLSTWKAELKSRLQKMTNEKGAAGKSARRRPGSRRYVLHVDFDSFFCAVSLKKHPEYSTKPAVVAHGSGAGSEIASCNYPAREFGITNGMWMKRALDLCSDLKVLPYDFPAYEDASRLFYESILGIGGVVQSVSIDEALVDVSSIVLSATGSQGIRIDKGSIWREQEMVDRIAHSLRETIKDKTGCHVSVGIGGNILQAKIALRKAKPAGQYHLKPEEVLGVIGGLKVEQLPGVAYSIGGKLEDIGVKFVKDLRELSRERLSSVLGPKTGEKLREYARGIDKTEVGEQSPRKSVSAEVNWGVRFISQQEAEEFVCNLCKELERRLLNEQVRGRQLTMKIMRRSLDAPLDPAKHLGHGKCDVFNKSTTFGVATHSFEVLGKESVSILRSFRFSPGDLRGLGIQMTKLEPIKSSPSAPDGSQPKLLFNAFNGPSPAVKNPKREPIDESDGLEKMNNTARRSNITDPIIEDQLTPPKQRVHPAMAMTKAAEKDAKAKTPLNVSGTQFIIPSNADPATIAELPSDIRSRMMAQKPSKKDHAPMSPGVKSQPGFPFSEALPSQVDAEVFDALPDDVKAEVLASYGRKPVQGPQHSLHKDSPIQAVKKSIGPNKRDGIRGMLGKPQRQRDAQAGLLQTNFKNGRPDGDEYREDGVIKDLDPAFLAELPEDVRNEVIADHRRRRLAQRSGLDAPVRRQQNAESEALPGGQRRIYFPNAPAKVSFAGSGVSSVQEIKDMLDAWHAETRENGPHHGDVEVFEKYLGKVIQEERDMEKAVKLIKWLEVIVQQEGLGGEGQQAWWHSLEGVKAAAREAVKQRGLASLDL